MRLSKKKPARSPSTNRSHSNLAQSCEIKRGPNWLLLRWDPELPMTQSAEQAEAWAQELWDICDRHFTYRLVVELNQPDALSPAMDRAFTELHERLARQQGGLRVCGVTKKCRQQLHQAHSELRLHDSQREAVLSTDSHRIVVKPR